MLEFNSGTGGTIGNDYSTKGNNWTSTGHYFTSATNVQYDWMDDTGSNNHCTLSPLNIFSSGYLSEANLKQTPTSAVWTAAAGTFAMSSGKWYWEVTVTNGGSNYTQIGVTKATQNLVSSGIEPGATANYWMYSSNGNKYLSTVSSAYGATYATNDVIGVAFDADAGTLVFYKNNTSQGTATTLSADAYVPAFGAYNTTSALQANFGQRPFTYAPPTSFKLRPLIGGHNAGNSKEVPAPSKIKWATSSAVNPSLQLGWATIHPLCRSTHKTTQS
jgi:hypothetical protein